MKHVATNGLFAAALVTAIVPLAASAETPQLTPSEGMMCNGAQTSLKPLLPFVPANLALFGWAVSINGNSIDDAIALYRDYVALVRMNGELEGDLLATDLRASNTPTTFRITATATLEVGATYRLKVPKLNCDGSVAPNKFDSFDFTATAQVDVPDTLGTITVGTLQYDTTAISIVPSVRVSLEPNATFANWAPYATYQILVDGVVLSSPNAAADSNGATLYLACYHQDAVPMGSLEPGMHTIQFRAHFADQADDILSEARTVDLRCEDAIEPPAPQCPGPSNDCPTCAHASAPCADGNYYDAGTPNIHGDYIYERGNDIEADNGFPPGCSLAFAAQPTQAAPFILLIAALLLVLRRRRARSALTPTKSSHRRESSKSNGWRRGLASSAGSPHCP